MNLSRMAVQDVLDILVLAVLDRICPGSLSRTSWLLCLVCFRRTPEISPPGIWGAQVKPAELFGNPIFCMTARDVCRSAHRVGSISVFCCMSSVADADFTSLTPATVAAILGGRVVPGRYVILVGFVERQSNTNIFEELQFTDGSGRLGIRHFFAASPEQWAGRYVRVVGQVKLTNTLYVWGDEVQEVASADEISYHAIEVAHCFLTRWQRQPPLPLCSGSVPSLAG